MRMTFRFMVGAAEYLTDDAIAGLVGQRVTCYTPDNVEQQAHVVKAVRGKPPGGGVLLTIETEEN